MIIKTANGKIITPLLNVIGAAAIAAALASWLFQWPFTFQVSAAEKGSTQVIVADSPLSRTPGLLVSFSEVVDKIAPRPQRGGMGSEMHALTTLGNSMRLWTKHLDLIRSRRNNTDNIGLQIDSIPIFGCLQVLYGFTDRQGPFG